MKTLERVHRPALIRISGAIRTPTPTLVLNAMLNVVPADIASKVAAARSAVRLRGLGYRLDLTYGYSSILRNFGFISLSTAQCKPSLSQSGIFSTHIPSKEEGAAFGDRAYSRMNRNWNERLVEEYSVQTSQTI